LSLTNGSFSARQLQKSRGHFKQANLPCEHHRPNRLCMPQNPAPRTHGEPIAIELRKRHAVHDLDYTDQSAEIELLKRRKTWQEVVEFVPQVTP